MRCGKERKRKRKRKRKRRGDHMNCPDRKDRTMELSQ